MKLMAQLDRLPATALLFNSGRPQTRHEQTGRRQTTGHIGRARGLGILATGCCALLVAACSGDVNGAGGDEVMGAPSGADPMAMNPGDPALPGISPTDPMVPTSAVGDPAAPVVTPTDPANPANPADPANPVDPADPAASIEDPTEPAASTPVEEDTPPLPSDPTAVATACDELGGAIDVGLTKLRRLTRAQFNNTVRDLLGATGTPADALPPDERMGPFNSNANAPITDLMVEQHQEIAILLANEAQARMNEIAPCDLAADSGTACATDFVTQFGERAYRRPLTEAEVQQYLALYTLGQQGAATPGAANGFKVVVQAMLQSPFFLYHHDVGSSGSPETGPVDVTPYELASRLSYFLWNSMPDDALFAAAADGSLTQDAVLSAQVERMLADDKALDSIPLFHLQWLGVEDVSGVSKDATLFPQFSSELSAAMQRETATFSDYVVRSGDGLLSTLLTASYSFPEQSLLPLYGVSEPAGFAAGDRVDLDPTQRAGILTQASILAKHAHPNQTSPVHRGILVRENLLCQIIPPPPSDVVPNPPAPTVTTTTRERFAQHVADPGCAACHQLMDPLGLGFENYDAIGAYRTMDGDNPVDATGEVLGADVTGAYNGAVELAGKLATSQTVQGCVTNQWFRFALGRIESRNEACVIENIQQGFIGSGGNIRTLLTQIALSDAFRKVRSTGEEAL